MLFTEPLFLGFFAVVFLLRWVLLGYGAQKNLLLISSYVFYGAWDYRFLVLIAGSTLLDYLVGRGLGASEDSRRRRLLLCGSLLGNLGLLSIFKYYNFFVEAGSTVLTMLGLSAPAHTLEIILPVGISFFTFQTMSYTLDIYRRRLEPIESFRDFALYVSFFPQLVAGPIVRARDFLPQLESPRLFSNVDVRRYLALFIVGYFKKVCIADNIAHAIDPIYANPALHGAQDAAIAIVGYSIQIYCDFSGYTDMAIAVAGLLGFELVKNFDAPYLSRSIRDFWQRWHISLSSWLRDYLYISLGGNRNSRVMLYRNLMLTMILGGLWHGANLTFVLWGALHGLALVAQRLWSERRGPRDVAPRWLQEMASWLLTLLWVVVCFALFRSQSVADFFVLLSQLTVVGQVPELRPSWWPFFTLLAVAQFAAHRFAGQLAESGGRIPGPVYAFALGVAAALSLFLTPMRSTPFIYFQF